MPARNRVFDYWEISVDHAREEPGCIERKAQEIAQRTGWPRPIARAAAMAEFRRIQDRPKAPVIPFDQGRLFASEK